MIRPDDLVVNRWGARFQGQSLCCAVGKNGITRNKREGDGATPAGIWRLTGGMWRTDRGPRPDTILPLRAAGPRDLWCDAPESPLYNRAFNGYHPTVSHERLRRADPLYDIVLFSDFNTIPAVSGAGSAIFVHCWRTPRRGTEGCVAFASADLRWIIARWQPWSRVVVQP